MFGIPDRIKGVSHPLVADMYLKKEHNGQSFKDVLVIETYDNVSDVDFEHDAFDSYLIDILADLEDLKQQAERSCGVVDRVDIRTH